MTSKSLQSPIIDDSAIACARCKRNAKHIAAFAASARVVVPICCENPEIPSVQCRHLNTIDEADQITRAAQIAFLSKLDCSRVTRPPKTIFVFTANETALLEKRFISRCRVVPFDGRREIESARDFLARVWASESSAPPPDFAALLDANEGNIRAALNAIEMELIAPGQLVPAVAVPIVTKRDLPRPVMRAVHPHRAKPTDELRAAARRLKAEGLPLGKIAAQLNAPQSSVWRWTR